MTVSASPPETGNRNRTIIIGGALALAVVCACCVAAAGLILDPFGWNLLGLLFGRADPLAASMPADTTYYLSVDLFKTTPEKINRILQPFSDALGVDETQDLDSMMEELDKSVLSNLDMTFKDDIEPWIGQFIGVGIQNIQFADTGPADTPGFILAVETRNGGKADTFLKKLRDKSFAQSGETLKETQYQGVTIYSSTPQYGQGTAFTRSGNAILLGTSLRDVQDAIDAQKGDSLADSGDYRDAVGALPSGRILTMYMDMEKMIDPYLSILESMGMGDYSDSMNQEQLDALTQALEDNKESMVGTALSVSIVDAGLQIDVVSILDTGKQTADRKKIAAGSGPAKDVIALLPQDTLCFAAMKFPHESIVAARDTLLDFGSLTRDEYNEAIQRIEDELGINLDTDLIPYLGGEMAVAVFPSTDGFLAQSADADIGGILLMETGDSKAMQGTLDKLADYVVETGIPIDRRTAGDLTYYEIAGTIGAPDSAGKIVLGVGNKYLAVGTSGRALEDVFSGKTSLMKSDRYRKAVNALPGGISPVLYLDLERLLDIVGEGLSGGSDEPMNALEPVTAIIAGTAPPTGRTTRSTLVILIKPVE